MWIDYKKAYDLVPHEWMIECLDLYKINKTSKNFLVSMIKNWKTNVNINSLQGPITTENIYF